MGEEVHNLIRDFRISHGLTQDELAHAVGVSRQSIISIERGAVHTQPFPGIAFRPIL
jgi:DNA-binding XRE family transcriptional regulator